MKGNEQTLGAYEVGGQGRGARTVRVTGLGEADITD